MYYLHYIMYLNTCERWLIIASKARFSCPVNLSKDVSTRLLRVCTKCMGRVIAAMASSHLQYGTILVYVPMFITDSLVDKSTSIVITFDSERTITSDPSLELEFESSTISLGPVVRSRVSGSRYHSFDAYGICNGCYSEDC